MSLLFLEPVILPLSITDGIGDMRHESLQVLSELKHVHRIHDLVRGSLSRSGCYSAGAIKQAGGQRQIRLSDVSPYRSVEDVSVSLHRLAIAALRAATVTKRLSIEAISRLGSGGACDSSTFRASEPSRFSFQVVAGNDAAPALPLDV